MANMSWEGLQGRDGGQSQRTPASVPSGYPSVSPSWSQGWPVMYTSGGPREMYFYPQPVLPTAPIGPYSFPFFAYQMQGPIVSTAPMVLPAENWQGQPRFHHPHRPTEAGPSTNSSNSEPASRGTQSSSPYQTPMQLRPHSLNRSRDRPKRLPVGNSRDKRMPVLGSAQGSSTSSLQDAQQLARQTSQVNKEAPTQPSPGEVEISHGATEPPQLQLANLDNTKMSTSAELKDMPKESSAEGLPLPYSSTMPGVSRGAHLQADIHATCDAPMQETEPIASSALLATAQQEIDQALSTDESRQRVSKKTYKKPCPYFLRTGTCEYGDKCKFSHPENQKPIFTSAGLPVRPGRKYCRFHELYKWCGFGKQCKFSHREDSELKFTMEGAKITNEHPGGNSATVTSVTPDTESSLTLPTSASAAEYANQP